MRELLALNKYLKTYQKALLLGVICVFISNIFGIVVPTFIRTAIDDAVFHASFLQSSAAFTDSLLGVFIGFSLLILIASIGKGIFTYLMRQYIIKTSRRIEYDLKNSIYDHFQKLSTRFFQVNYTGDMMARIGEDVSNVRMYVGPVIMYVANLTFAFITVVYQMIHVNAAMSAFVLIPLPFLSFIIYIISKKIHLYTAKIQTQLSIISTFAQESFSGIRVIKAFAVEQEFGEKLNKESEKFRLLNLKLAFVNALFFPLMQLLMGLSSLLVLYLGSRYVVEGTFTVGNFAEFIIYLNLLIWPVASLGWTSALAQKAAASQKRINEILDKEPEDLHAGDPFNFEKSIVLKDINYKYADKTKNSLSDITLKIPKGHKLGIIGKTGSGKSTLIKCLMREIDPEGFIQVDSKDLDSFSLNTFRKKVAYVPQDVYLFSDTIKNNIALGGDNPSDTEINRAAKMAHLEHDFDQLKDGIHTLLGERGVSISGGQKQRVSIARALLAKSDLFILDDALSAVDSETEHEILKNIYTHLDGTTLVICSHRIAAVSQADTVITMDEGKIVEIGRPSELLAKKGYFARQHKLQTQIEP
ncbi:ABC transporter ATP-binding protein/permease [Bacteroidia bacterium]|nr:ABC transporter ATP-binding protein/permease [Bacteroidia bacterium]